MASRAADVIAVALFADSEDAVVLRDTVLHEKRSIDAGKAAATNLEELVTHSHRLCAADNQVVGCVVV